MNEQRKLRKVFEGILSSQSFDMLNGFSNDSSWESLLPEERDLLAQLFLLSAETTSSDVGGDVRRRAVGAYRSACRLVPSSARVWYRLGAYLALGENAEDVEEAIEALTKAIELDARFFDAQYALATASLRLGVMENDEDLLCASEKAFSQAAELVGHPDGESTASGEFYWHWGISRFALARHSGEPIDLKSAIEMYGRAYSRGLARADFFNDFANALVELSLLISNDALIVWAMSLYSSAVAATVGEGYDRAERLFNLGCCAQHLYDLCHEEEQFEAASKAFSDAAEITSEIPAIWQRWGLLLFRRAQLECDTKLAEEALTKLQAAEQKGLEHPVALAACARILSWLAYDNDDLGQLRTAERYATRAIAAQDACGERFAETFATMSFRLHDLGLYFSDASFFTRAIALAQTALSDHPRSAVLWHALGLAKFSEGEAIGSDQAIREALVCFALASRSGYALHPAFWNDWGLALLTLAECLEDGELATEAVAKLEMAVQLVHQRCPQWMVSLARAYDVLGDLSGDEEWYDRSLQILSDLVERGSPCEGVQYQLGAAYFHRGESCSDPDSLRAAAMAFGHHLTAEPEDDDAWAEYGLVLIHLGEILRSGEGIPSEWFAAEEALLNALGLGNDRTIYHLACLYSLMGNFGEAFDLLYKAADGEALPPVADLVEDEWLAPIASTASFHKFLQYVRLQEG